MKAAIQEGERIERGTFASPEAWNKAVADWVAKYDRRINSYPFNIRHFLDRFKGDVRPGIV